MKNPAAVVSRFTMIASFATEIRPTHDPPIPCENCAGDTEPIGSYKEVDIFVVFCTKDPTFYSFVGSHINLQWALLQSTQMLGNFGAVRHFKSLIMTCSKGLVFH